MMSKHLQYYNWAVLIILSFCIGCLPTLATIPVWIGLYQALSNVANEVINGI